MLPNSAKCLSEIVFYLVESRSQNNFAEALAANKGLSAESKQAVLMATP